MSQYLFDPALESFPRDVALQRWSAADGDRDEYFMRMALAEATVAAEEGEIPIGAVLTCRDRVLARDHNRREQLRDPIAHAETLVLRRAAIFYPSWRVEEATLYVTLEPCLMCCGAILQSRVDRLVFGARDPKGGAAVSLYETLSDQRFNWRAEICEGVLQKECSAALVEFFRARRLRKSKT